MDWMRADTRRESRSTRLEIRLACGPVGHFIRGWALHPSRGPMFACAAEVPDPGAGVASGIAQSGEPFSRCRGVVRWVAPPSASATGEPLHGRIEAPPAPRRGCLGKLLGTRT